MTVEGIGNHFQQRHLINSSDRSDIVVCPHLGIFAWKQQYLTKTVLVTIIVTSAVSLLTIPFTILLNLLVILAVKRKRYLRKKHHILLACLAGTDLLVGAIGQPLFIVCQIQHLLGMGPICLLDSILGYVLFAACVASLLHLTIIGCERYISIKYALRYTTLVTTRRITIVITAAWILSVLFAVLSIERLTKIPAIKITVEIVSNVIILFSLSAIFFCHSVVFLEGRRHRKHIKAHLVSPSSAKELLKRNRVAVTTTLIVFAVFLCYTPEIVFLGITFNIEHFPGSLFHTILPVTDLLVTANSLINPLIYSARTREFRTVFREILHFGNSQMEPPCLWINEVCMSKTPRGNFIVTKLQRTEHSGLASQRALRSRSLDLSQSSACPRLHRSNSI